MTMQELFAAAKAAINTGDVEKAGEFTAQAKALKEVEALEADVAAKALSIEAEIEATAAAKAVAEQLEALETENAKLKADSANAKAGFQVVEDETDKKAAEPWSSFGEQLKAIRNAALYPHAMDDRLKTTKAALGQNETVGSDGGFLVHTDFANGIFSIEHNAGPLAQRCRRIPIGANSNSLKMNAVAENSRATGSRWGGITGYWVAEAGTITASQGAFRQMELTLHKMAVAAYATEELLADTTALGNIFQQGAREELAFMLDDTIMNGTGAGQPAGIVGSPALITVDEEGTQGAATIVYENILNMWSRAHSRSRMSPNMIWAINQDIEPQLNSMTAPVGTGGVPVYLPPGGLSESPYATLMGKPVVPTEFSSTLGTVGDIMLIDLEQYLLIDKGGVESGIHVEFLTDQRVYKFTYRVDGQPLWNAPLTPYKGSATQSPFVALATRS